MQYKLIADSDSILRLNDDSTVSWIPNNTANRDWQEYQEWIADGNEPLPADA